MKIDIRDLVESTGSFEGDESVVIEDPMGGEMAMPCRVRVDFRQGHGSTIHFNGTVTSSLLTQCHRCLDPVRYDLLGDFELMVLRGEHGAEEGEDVLTLPLQQYDVDLDPYLHEAVVLGTPMIVLCREDCRGLCPTCGVNWNRETCSCSPDADPRWDALRGKS